jgi:hypothetical protein
MKSSKGSTAQTSLLSSEDPGASGNGSVPPGLATVGSVIDEHGNPVPEAALKPKRTLAEALLLPNPDILTSTVEQVVVDVVGKLEPVEFFRTHPTMRLTLNLVTPNRQDIGAYDYAVLPEALPLLVRHKLRPSLVTLYPIVIGTKPLTYKLMRVKHPMGARKWDTWNLSRRQILDQAVGQWLAMRELPGGGYGAVPPDPEAEFPEPVFPDWTVDDWLQRSFGAQDLILSDNEDHTVFRALRGLGSSP